MTKNMEQATSTGLDTSMELTDKAIESKCRELLTQLSLDEKIEVMCGDPPFWTGLTAMMNGLQSGLNF